MTFIAPLGLALSALALPLLALYFVKLRRKRVKVPSILLWEQFKRSQQLATPFQRFRKHLLLLLQLLLLALLVLAFARPYLEANVAVNRTVVIVLDTSASMGATDVAPSRMGAALEEAERIVTALGATDEVMIVLAGSRTEVKVPFTRELPKVFQALGEIKATEAEGSLRDGLQLALSLSQARPGVEVFVLSDGSGEELADLPSEAARIHYTPIGSSANNTGIIAVDLRRSPVSDLDRELFVTVQSFGSAPTEGTVEIYVDGELAGLRTEPLPADTPVSMVFDLPASQNGDVRIELDAPNDNLPADDTAWLVAEPAAARSVVLVDGDRLTAKVLRADPRVELTLITASQLDAATLGGADCLLIGGAVPKGLEGLNVAVLRPTDGGVVAFGDEQKNPAVVGWRRTHPVLRFVALENITVASSRNVADAGGLSSIVDGDLGPLMLAGEVAGGRMLQLAFDPLKSDLPLRVAYPVLILNTVGWLTEGGAASGGKQTVMTGTPWLRRLPEGADPTSVRVTGPGGRVDAPVADGLLRVQDTSRIGIYRVKSGEVDTAFSANLLSPRESRIAPLSNLDLGSGETGSIAASVTGRREIWRPLVLFGLFVLMLEWIFWHRRRFA